MFKRKLSIFLLSCIICPLSFAQIVLTPYVDASSNEGLNANNIAVLEGSLRTLITRAGLESGYGGRFILGVNVGILDKSFTNTIPTKVVQKVQITYAIGDGLNGTCYGVANQEITGVGDTDVQAILNCFRNIHTNHSLNDLIATSKNRIISYYETNGAAIIAHAKSLVAGQRYEEALYELSFIPSECSNYSQVAQMMSDIYERSINHDAAQILAQAQAVWSSDPNPGPAAEMAADLLGQINTSASCYSKAQALLTTIKNRVQSVTDKRYTDEISLEKARINARATFDKERLKACREVAVAYAKNQPKVVYKVHWW